jgi:hypothetical protein
MTQGIRTFVSATFTNMLKHRAKLGNTEFRRAVMNAAIEEFGITIASAATHYNYALKLAKQETLDQVEGLGRDPSKNNGGPKPLYPVSVIKSRSREIVAEGLSRAKAQQMVDESVGQGKPKLEIYEPEEAAPAPRVAPRVAPVRQYRRETDARPQHMRDLVPPAPAPYRGKERRMH